MRTSATEGDVAVSPVASDASMGSAPAHRRTSRRAPKASVPALPAFPCPLVSFYRSSVQKPLVEIMSFSESRHAHDTSSNLHRERPILDFPNMIHLAMYEVDAAVEGDFAR